MKLFERWKHIGLIGGGISLIGTLPFGVLNILAFTIGAQESVIDAVLFSIGVILAEVAIVACCLQWFRFNKIWVWELLQYLLVGFLFFIAFQQFQQIGSSLEKRINYLDFKIPRFFLGLFLSALNPSQFPFWITWNGILGSKGLLQTNRNRAFYLIGIGVGTFCGLSCFILASQFISNPDELFHSKAYYLSVSVIFALTGIAMLFKLIRKHVQSAHLR